MAARLVSRKRGRLLIKGSRFERLLTHKRTRKRLIRYSLVVANIIVLAVVVLFVVSASQSTSPTSSIGTVNEDAAANPVDGQTAYDIAANVARMANLPESTAINNQAQTAQAVVAVSASASDIVAKPQIVATALKSRQDIQTYIAQSGDTIASIAQKFGITSDSVTWSNNLTGNTVAAGTKLTIPPVDGIVYTVLSGDTPQSLATKFSANADQIVAYNDAEIAGITPGEQILIPNGQIQAVSASIGTASSGALGGVLGAFTPIYSSTASDLCAQWVARYPCLYGNNGYDYGWCTWYVASRISMPSNWGNASTWAYYAARSGWTVSKTPVPGAIIQTASGDHVGYVEQVSADGTQIIYSDMNGLAGWGRVGVSDWVSASSFDGHSDVEYIYH